jgi:hypothetical protein
MRAILGNGMKSFFKEIAIDALNYSLAMESRLLLVTNGKILGRLHFYLL